MGLIRNDCGCVYHSDGFDNDHEIVERCRFHRGLKRVEHPARPPARERGWLCRLALHPVDGCSRCGARRGYVEYVKLTEQEKEQGEARLHAKWQRKRDAGKSHGRWLT
jgi:hypothetical protein